jgi:hypothetical protein
MLVNSTVKINIIILKFNLNVNRFIFKTYNLTYK